MTNTIAVFRDGAFRNESQPDWWDKWDAEMGGSDDKVMLGAGDTNDRNEQGEGILSWPCPEGTIVSIAQIGSGRSVGGFLWLPTKADLFAFICGPGATFIRAGVLDEQLHLLRRIANVLTAYARHGQGNHIDQYSGASIRDS